MSARKGVNKNPVAQRIAQRAKKSRLSYAPHWPEENVYHWLSTADHEFEFAVFAIQKASKEFGCFAVGSTTTASGTRPRVVFDLEGAIDVANFPCSSVEYSRHLISQTPCPAARERVFRVVPAAAFLEHFCSDRSHRLENGTDTNPYGYPTPDWLAPCACRRQHGATSCKKGGTLSAFLSVEAETEASTYTTLYDEHEFQVWLLEGTECPEPAFPISPVGEPNTLAEWALVVLNTADMEPKCAATRRAAFLWKSGKLDIGRDCTTAPPDHSARPSHIQVLPQHEMPKRQGLGAKEGRIELVHSLVFIESMALDLSWDIIARFLDQNMPRTFFDDFCKIAEDEQRHYSMLHERLTTLGGSFGDHPGHDGLWESATTTKHSLLARLCVEHIVHEGHGLDSTPRSIARMSSSGDKESAVVLEEILADEVTHVTAGVKWFGFLAARDGVQPEDQTATRIFDPVLAFHAIVPMYFRGGLRPPFAHDLRAKAGMDKEWYEPLQPSKR